MYRSSREKFQFRLYRWHIQTTFIVVGSLYDASAAEDLWKHCGKRRKCSHFAFCHTIFNSIRLLYFHIHKFLLYFSQDVFKVFCYGFDVCGTRVQLFKCTILVNWQHFDVSLNNQVRSLSIWVSECCALSVRWLCHLTYYVHVDPLSPVCALSDVHWLFGVLRRFQQFVGNISALPG